MNSANDIRGQIAAFLAKGIDLEFLEDWVAQHTWNIAKSGDADCRNLAFGVELRLSEYSSGHLTEQQLRDELGALLVSNMATIVMKGSLVESGASNIFT